MNQSITVLKARLSRADAPNSKTCARTPITTIMSAALVSILMLFAGACLAADDRALPDDLTHFSLEELMDIEVTSVSKRPEKRAHAAAAIFVITAEDLHNWGVVNIPDALRMVPGLHVARIDSNKWAVTSRGFNSRFANKLLVLIDGRSVYTPLFAGVYWEAQNPPIEDIKRIEVIRGPGGTLWGANAVNGVINIITRSANETQGGLLSLGAGNEERGFGSVRFGGKLDDSLYYRVYGKAFKRDEGYNAQGAHDDWELAQLGFRSDWDPDTANHFTLQGDYYEGDANQQITTAVDPAPATVTSTDGVEMRGGNILFRWQHIASNASDFSLQVYFDKEKRDGAVLYEDRRTFDIDFQHHLQAGPKHDIVWGLGYRQVEDDTRNNSSFSLVPTSRSVELLSGFIQDAITLKEDRLTLTLGSKLEHNDFTGTEVQPNIRLAWTPDNRQTVWGAVSRAVRTPARGEHDVKLRIIDPGAFPVTLLGNHDFTSEELIAYEIGYRVQASSDISIDVASFYNDYRNLRTFDPDATLPPVSLPFDNRLDGNTYGLEIATQWQFNPRLRVQAAYSYLQLDLNLQSGTTDLLSLGAQDSSPQHQANLWSTFDLGDQWELGAGLRYVSDLRTAVGDVGDYTALDARLGWQPSQEIDLSLVGRGLLDNRKTEFHPDFIQTQATDVERSVYFKLGWRF